MDRHVDVRTVKNPIFPYLFVYISKIGFRSLHRLVREVTNRKFTASNAWSPYMAEAVAQLKREGYPVHESDLAHIWPSRYEHINVYGRYHFNIEEARRRKGLRPLRQSGVTIP